MSNNIISVDVVDELSDAMLHYAAAVNLGRALPSAYDGLKPVQRRVLYAMHELHLRHDMPFKKCARIDGDVTGKFHPHGGAYGALVNLATAHSNRYQLIDGQGNFGSISDGAAAARYTECRLQRFTEEVLLRDIDYAEYRPNYDGSLQEPVELPARLPMLLLRETSGIGYAIACSHLSYNLREVADLSIAALERTLPSDSAGRWLSRPDFATGAEIGDYDGRIPRIISTGQGTVYGNANLRIDREEMLIYATELPPDVSPEQLIDQTLQAIREERLDRRQISAVRDETDRSGVRVVWELRNLHNVETLIFDLCRVTDCRKAISSNPNAVVDNTVQMLSPASVANHWAIKRRAVEIRKLTDLVSKLSYRLASLEAFLTAIRNKARVLELIESNQSLSELGLSVAQCRDVEAMQLGHFRNAAKYEAEAAEATATLAKYESLLNDSAAMTKHLQSDVRSLKKQFGDDFRTMLYVEGEIDELAKEQALQRAAQPAPRQDLGWLILHDRHDYSFYRQPKQKHPDYEAVAAEGTVIASVYESGLIVYVKPEWVPMGGKDVHKVKLINAAGMGQGEALWTGIVKLDEAWKTELILVGSTLVKRVNLQQLNNCLRRGKGLFHEKLIAVVNGGCKGIQVTYTGGAVSNVASTELPLQNWANKGLLLRGERDLALSARISDENAELSHRRS